MTLPLRTRNRKAASKGADTRFSSFSVILNQRSRTGLLGGVGRGGAAAVSFR